MIRFSPIDQPYNWIISSWKAFLSWVNMSFITITTKTNRWKMNKIFFRRVWFIKRPKTVNGNIKFRRPIYSIQRLWTTTTSRNFLHELRNTEYNRVMWCWLWNIICSLVKKNQIMTVEQEEKILKAMGLIILFSYFPMTYMVKNQFQNSIFVVQHSKFNNNFKVQNLIFSYIPYMVKKSANLR